MQSFKIILGSCGSERIQAFEVYNNNEGELIVAKIGRNSVINPNVIIFQDGQSPYAGYVGTTDVTLEEALFNSNTGNLPVCYVDGDEPPRTGQDRATLLRWDVSAIPEDSTIIEVSVTLSVVDITNEVYYVYEMKQDWVESQATWDFYRNNRQWVDKGASSVQDQGQTKLGTLRVVDLGKTEIPLNNSGVAVVQSWIRDPANNRGLIIKNADAIDGVDFSCSEDNVAINRPRLTITYTTP